MKWIQFGDLHLDAPFRTLKPSAAAAHRRAARALLREIVHHAEAVGADAILCTGDLFDSQTPYRDTVEAVAQAFAETALPVFITPGNHDFYAAASPYCASEWSENVHIFTAETPETVTIGKVTVTGVAFCSDQPSLRPLNGWHGDGVFLGHGDALVNDSVYAAYPQADIAASGLAYLALGHIHQPEVQRCGQTLVVQNGSVEGRGFDEIGPRGFFEVTWERGEPTWRMIPSSGCRAMQLTLEGGPHETAAILAVLRERCEVPPERTLLRLTVAAKDPTGLAEALDEAFLCVRLTLPPQEAERPTVRSPLMQLYEERAKAAMAAAATDADRRRMELACRFGMAAMENREQPSLETERNAEI